MKQNIILLIILLTPFLCFPQNEKIEIKIVNKPNDTIKVLLTPILKLPFENFVKDSKLYNLNLDNLHDLHSIVFSNVIIYYTGSEGLGLTLSQKDFPNIIFINDKILFPEIIEITLYHELVHQITQNDSHCDDKGCPLLFSSNANNISDGKKVYIELLYNWEKHKRNFFEYLKKVG